MKRKRREWRNWEEGRWEEKFRERKVEREREVWKVRGGVRGGRKR